MHRMLDSHRIKLTYRDYCALPEDGRRREILDGDVYTSPSPLAIHQIVALNLAATLLNHVNRHRLGRVFAAPFDVLLGPHDIVVPDLVYCSSARASIVTDKNIKGAPDLLVEILSASTAPRDRRDKRAIYARAGVPFSWIIDPKRVSILELELAGDGYATVNELGKSDKWRPRLFPKLQIPVDSLWK